MMTVSGRSPGSVIQLLPAASASARSPSPASTPSSHRRASRHTGPHATRWAPWASLVRAARARRSAITSRPPISPPRAGNHSVSGDRFRREAVEGRRCAVLIRGHQPV